MNQSISFLLLHKYHNCSVELVLADGVLVCGQVTILPYV